MQWNEGMIARSIGLQTLARKCVVLVDRCNWTGHECDVLGVTTDLRIIDIEIKIIRSDLKADAHKDKWWHRYYDGTYEDVTLKSGRQYRRPVQKSEARQHPPKVWKHYYAMPREIWKPELLDCLPSTASGVLLLREQRNSHTPIAVHVERRATPNKEAAKLKPEQVVDIARLANLRMWDAYRRAEENKRQASSHEKEGAC